MRSSTSSIWLSSRSAMTFSNTNSFGKMDSTSHILGRFFDVRRMERFDAVIAPVSPNIFDDLLGEFIPRPFRATTETVVRIGIAGLEFLSHLMPRLLLVARLLLARLFLALRVLQPWLQAVRCRPAGPCLRER